MVEKNNFFNKLQPTLLEGRAINKQKGGIYLIQYKDDLNIFYIGRAINFKRRLNMHLKTKTNDKFHLFANFVG